MAWTIAPLPVRRSGNYKFLTLRCVSDGNALSAADFLSETYMPRDIKSQIQGHTLMEIKSDPGAAAQPDQVWDFTLYDRDSDAILTITNTSQTAIAFHDTSTDIGSYPTIDDKMYVAFPTAADWTDKDSVDLIFKLWVEPGAK